MNILFIGAGKRNTMAHLFKNEGCRVFSYEIDSLSPISQECEIILGKKWSDPSIIFDLENTCKKYNIDLVIPFQDAAIEICAQLSNVLTINQNILTAQLCHDKRLFANFILGFKPEIYPNPSILVEENIYKPIFGFGSKNIFKRCLPPDNLNEYLSQKLIIGTEYSVDCFSSRNGRFIDCVPRERIEVCGGEVIKSKTVEQPILSQYCELICNKLQMTGPSCFQFIIEQNTGKPYILEINYRFGGGCTLSIESGLHMVKWIKSELNNVPIQHTRGNWKRNLYMSRYFKDCYFET